jgi:hypothetical protein
MANQLIGSGAATTAAPTPTKEKAMTQRCYLFSPDCPKGRIFEGEEAIAAALEDGWADAPGAVAEPKTAAKKASKKKVAPKKVATDDDSQ